MSQVRGDKLIDLLCVDGQDVDANDLLDEIHHGYPLEGLRKLLVCDGDAATKAAAWILSELGEDARPFLPEAVRLLHNPLKYVRFFALDVVLVAATEATDGPAIASAVCLIEDQEEAVRWKVLRLLARATPEQLRASLTFLDARPEIQRLTLRLAAIEGKTEDIQAITREVEDPDRLVALFAVAAAARIAFLDRGPINFAASVSDPEISAFARDSG